MVEGLYGNRIAIGISMAQLLLMKLSFLMMVLGLVPGWLAAQPPVYPLPILSATQAVAAVTFGDFDPLHSGDELACLMADGSVVELTLGESGWTANRVFEYKGISDGPWHPTMRATLNVGDVLPEHTDREIVLSFQRQVLAVYHTPSQGWTNQVIRDSTGLVSTTWGAVAGDCDRAHPGEEVFSILEQGFDFSAGTVYGATNQTWQSNEVYYGEVGMDAAIGDCNPDHAGKEVIVVTEMGPTYEITPPAAGGPGLWPRRTLWNDPENAGWVVKIADADPETPGNEIVYGTRYSDRIMMSRHNGTNAHQVEILLTGINTNHHNNMLDVAIGQVFPTSPSGELLGVDMSGSLYLVQRVTNQWRGSIIWQDTNALYAVTAADLLPTLPGDEIVVAGASGTVTLLCRPSPVLVPASPAQQPVVLSWTALRGLTYIVEASTNLSSKSSWNQVTNLTYQGAFTGTLRYTNTTANTAEERFFRVKASW
jgi:hypothetical protein